MAVCMFLVHGIVMCLLCKFPGFHGRYC
jgi:hypothetical protein